MAIIAGLGCGPAAGDDTGASSSGDPGSSTTGPEPSLQCPGPDEGLALTLTLNTFGGHTNRPCTIIAVEPGRVSLECEGDGGADEGSDSAGLEVFYVEWSATPLLAVAVDVGTEATLTTFTTDTWDHDDAGNRQSAIVREAASGALLVAAIEAFDDTWFDELAPIELAPIADACPTAPAQNNCLSIERRMWQATVDGQTEVVGDGVRRTLGRYEVHVQRAADGQLLECLDIDTDDYRALIVRSS